MISILEHFVFTQFAIFSGVPLPLSLFNFTECYLFIIKTKYLYYTKLQLRSKSTPGFITLLGKMKQEGFSTLLDWISCSGVELGLQLQLR